MREFNVTKHETVKTLCRFFLLLRCYLVESVVLEWAQLIAGNERQTALLMVFRQHSSIIVN